jgi:hypothetical protein
MAIIEFPHGQVAPVRRYAEEGVGCVLADLHNGVVGTAEKFAAEFPTSDRPASRGGGARRDL